MRSGIASKSNCKVVVVDPSGPVRQLMAEVLRSGLGFENVESRPSVEDVLSGLETEYSDWLIVPLMADQTVNALHLLSIITETPELKNVRVSLMIGEDERYVLPSAYTHGLLSHHPRPFTKEVLLDELSRLLQIFRECNNQEPLIAASYLRQLLKANERFSAQLELEKSLLELYPGNASVLLNLAEPEFRLGRKAHAKRVLSQVKMIAPEFSDRVDELAKSLLGTEGKITGTPSDFTEGDLNILGVNTCYIIDPDETVGNAVETLLTSVGVKNLRRFTDGEAAWEALRSSPEPDLIIMEWRIAGLTGPYLVQRIRSHGFHTAPIVILSSLIKASDMPLLREMGVATSISKPLHKDQFIPSLVWVLQQERMPTEQGIIERKIRSFLAAGKLSDAEPLRSQFIGDAAVPNAKKRLIDAEWAFSQGDYLGARDAAVESLKTAGDSLFVLNVLGKAFMYLREFEAALKCFKKAQESSPHNIERLCAIAETEIELGDTEDAQATLAEAGSLDSGSTTVSEAHVRVAISGGDTLGAKAGMNQLESLSNVIAYMNNKAVAHARCGYVSEAIELYRKTMESIPDDKQDIKFIVRYNLALAMIRASDLVLALSELEAINCEKESKFGKKVASLRLRLKTAIAQNQEFKLVGGDAISHQQEVMASSPETDRIQRAVIAQMDAKKGDICCYLIFTNSSNDERSRSLLLKAPRFQLRQAIEREEAMGAERTTKGGS